MKRRAEIWKGLNKGYRKRTKYNKRIKDIEKEDKKLSLITQLCLTLCNPWTVAYQAPLSMGIGFSGQEYWSELPCPPPGDLPEPGIELRSPALRADSLPSEPPGKPYKKLICLIECNKIQSL